MSSLGGEGRKKLGVEPLFHPDRQSPSRFKRHAPVGRSPTCPQRAPSALTKASHRARAHTHAFRARTRAHAPRPKVTQPCAHALPLHSIRPTSCAGVHACPEGLMGAA